MSQLITAELVDLDLSAATKSDAARSLAERMVSLGRVTDLDGFLADVAAREAQMPTGLDGGIGIPHCRSTHVSEPTLAFGRPPEPIDFGAPDGPADLVFLIAAPDGADSEHLTILSSLARRLADPEFTAALRSAADPEQASALIRGDSAPDTRARRTSSSRSRRSPIPGRRRADRKRSRRRRRARIQRARSRSAPSCRSSRRSPGRPEPAPRRPSPSESSPSPPAPPVSPTPTWPPSRWERAAAEDAADTVLTVETQGSAGFQRVDPAVIAAADAVIFAHDVEVRERERFAGKPTVDVGVKAAINRPAELLREARDRAERGEHPPRPAASAPMDAGAAQGDGFGTRLRTWLMTGVSYMVPFVAAGGLLLIALSFALGGYEIAGAKSVADHFVWTEVHSWAALLNQIGGLAFGFLVPVLAGYIAYGMADRPGLVPGFVGGAVAVQIEAGFLGGLVAGLLAGALVMAVQRVGVPAVLRGIMPVVVIPLLSSALVGALMFVVVGKPIATAQQAMTDWLGGLTGTNAVLLGLLIGLMMCFDLGGPVNKVAYTFATGGIASADPGNGSLMVMAAAMAAGMVPPLGMALATTVRGSLFTRTERENGKAAWVLGASFISEGAIPFAAADPLRVIPASMAGGAVTGALSMGFGSTLRAPHGGIFVVPLIGSPLLYLVAIAAGTLVTAGATLLLKGARKQSPEVRSSPAQDSAEPRATAGV